MTDSFYMELALREARLGEKAGEVPVGAVIVGESGRLLSRAYNSPISSCDPVAHAEINALRKAAEMLQNYRLPGVTLYVTVEPCPMCAGAIVNARVRRVVFGAWDLKAGACGSIFNIVSDIRLNHRVEVTGGVLEHECAEMLQTFFQKRRVKKL